MTKILLALSLLTLTVTAFAQHPPFTERDFIKYFAGKDIAYVREHLGEPSKKTMKENAGDVIEFWIYENIVLLNNEGKTFRYTQISLVNNRVETFGNTNRLP